MISRSRCARRTTAAIHWNLKLAGFQPFSPGTVPRFPRLHHEMTALQDKNATD